MIDIYNITLTRAQSKRLAKLAEKAGYIDDNLFLQEMIAELVDNKELPQLLGDLMAKEISK